MNSSISSFSPQRLAFLMLGISISAFLLMLVLSEIFLRFWVVPHDNFYKHLSFYESIDSVSVAAFGDSHMSQGFYPASDDVVNLAYPGENFEQIAVKIDRFLETKKARNIILQISPHMFADYRDDAGRDYNTYFGGNADWKKQWLLQDPNLRKQLLQFWTVFFTHFGQYPDKIHFEKNGAIIIDETMHSPPTEAEKKHITARIREHTLRKNYRDKQTWDVMRQTIEKIKAKGVDLCLVTLPVTPLYQEPVLKLEYTQEALDGLKEIAAEEHVPYFFDWSLYGSRYELFRDLDHLNVDGAKLFTTQILKDCGFN